jgi:hypothetical protein
MSTNAQWTPSSTTQTSLTQTGLTPGTSYVLLVRAYKNNSDGTKSYSDYASIPFKASDIAPSGLNALTVNNGTDILLNGGSIFAQNTNYPFPTNIGKFNVVSGTTTGTGVVLNNTGIAAFKQGTKQFYIDAATGNAYFDGTITVGALTNAGGVTTSNLSSTLANYVTTTTTIAAGYITTGVLASGQFYTSNTSYTYLSTDTTKMPHGTAYSSGGTAINLNDGTITAPGFRIDASGNAYFKGSVDGNSTINGTNASTVVSNASLGATAYGPALSAIQASTTFKATNNNVVAISTAGVTISTNGTGTGGASGTGSRVEFNSAGLYGFNGTTQTFGISASDGSAYFQGSIGSGSLITAPTISSGTITGSSYATYNGTPSGTTNIDINKTTAGAITFYNGASVVATIKGGTVNSVSGLQFTASGNTFQNFGNNYIALGSYTSTTGNAGLIMDGNIYTPYASLSAGGQSIQIDYSGVYINSNPTMTIATNGLRNTVAVSGSNPYTASVNKNLIVLVY